PLFALYPVEILLVGWISAKSKRSAVFWDSVYWVTVGLLIYYPSYQWLTESSDSNVVTFFLFSVANGLMNVFFGGLASEYVPDRHATTRKKWRIGRASFHLCMIIMIVPML